MIDIDFGEHAGGKRSFRMGDDLVKYISEQRSEWAKHPSLPDRQDDYISALKRLLLQPWDNLLSEVTSSQVDLSKEAPPRLVEVVATSAETKKLISLGSLAGRIVAGILQEHGATAASGAVKLHQSGPTAQIFGGMPKTEIVGAITFIQGLEGLSSHSIRLARDASRKAVRNLEDDVARHRIQLEEMEQVHRARLQEVVDERERQQEDFTRWRNALADEIQNERNSWEASWDNLYALFTERLRLESAVKLWNDRGLEHRRAATKWQNRSLGTAIVGLLFSGLFALGMLVFAKWLFSDALAIAEVSPTASGLRPTWQYEIIFTAAATLLYLTVYFWIMRIIVRLYMTEAHLEIDARSRSAMAETYLALTKESAATDADRAIVLASLFRPIADGIVSDDGLPAITPAAILSGLASGRP